MRTCEHLPGAAKELKCPLCKDLATYGKPVSKAAILTLNAQREKEKTRKCPRCRNQVRSLVTQQKELMCAACAVELDDEDMEG
jgi:hypothetical protein